MIEETGEPLSEVDFRANFSPLGAGYLLADVTRLMRAAFDEKMLELGLTATSWRVLVYLHRQDGMSQAELARQLEVSRASLGQMIDRLEASGHVARAEHPDDRRMWCVHLTDKTRKVMSDISQKAKDVHAASFGKLNPLDYERLTQILSQLRRIMLKNNERA